MYRHTASPVSLWPKVSGLRSGCPSSNLSVSLRSTRPGCGTQRLLRCRLHPAGRGPNSDSLFPPLAAVVAVAPGRGASGEKAKLCGMPRPPLGRGGGTASAVTERLSLARASRSGCPLSNLSVGLAPASSPSRGASGEEAKLCGMPRPPLGRGGGTASAVTERLSPAEACGQAVLRPTSQSASQTAPLVGEPLAKRQSFAECQGLPSVGEVARRQP